MREVNCWLDKVQENCRQMGLEYIDIIVDQCGLSFSVIPAFDFLFPELEWHSLYEGLPENIFLEDAPLLMRIDLNEDQQVMWLYDLARNVYLTAPLLAICSSWPFSELSSWLGSCVSASHEMREGIFRFWDTRILRYLFTHILDETQQNQLHTPVLCWSWMNEDGEPEIFTGQYNMSGNEKPQKIVFNDKQFEMLMCLCDAKVFLSDQVLPEGIFPGKKAEFSACFEAMLAATNQGVLLEEDRYTWVCNYLCQSK